MKTLESIQKACRVFKTLSRVAMILSFVGAGFALAGLLCGIAWRSGGSVVGISMEDALNLTQVNGLTQMIGALLADLVLALTDGFLFFFACRTFQQELADGTPFTPRCADQVRDLGIKTIVMPLVAVIISAVIYECFGLSRPGSWDNGAAVVLGVALILFSLVLRHGAELFERWQEEGDNNEKG